jgi:hypothetical protein
VLKENKTECLDERMAEERKERFASSDVLTAVAVNITVF